MNRALYGVIPYCSFVVASVLHLKASGLPSSLANAGMEGATVVAPLSGCVRPIDAAGLPLGVQEAVQYEPASLLLASRDSIFLCTDGVRDVCNAAGEPFRTCLPEVLMRAAMSTSFDEQFDIVQTALKEFAPPGNWEDDACFIVVTAR
jgi:serine phosphatase RsbU (regulator of sigma subunit)